MLTDSWDEFSDLLAVVHVRLVNIICGIIQDGWYRLIPELLKLIECLLVYLLHHPVVLHLELLRGGV